MLGIRCLPSLCVLLTVIHSCYSHSLGHFISQYDVLSYPASVVDSQLHRTRRSASTLPQTHTPIRLPIVAFSRHFTIVLSSDDTVINPSAKLIVGGQEKTGGLASVADHMVHGYVENHEGSFVYGSIINGVFRGRISFGGSDNRTEIYGSYYVEPAGNYFDRPTSFHSVIYHDSHVKTPEIHRVRRSADGNEFFGFCGLSNPKVVQKMSDLAKSVPGVHVEAFAPRSRRASVTGKLDLKASQPQFHSSTVQDSPEDMMHSHLFTIHDLPVGQYGGVRSSPYNRLSGPNNRVCNLYLQSDTFLWDRVISLQHVHGDRELAVKEITSIFTQHVQGAQAIYQYTMFRDHSGRLEFPGISFRVDHVLINVTDEDCKARFPDRRGRNRPPPTPTALPHANTLLGSFGAAHQQADRLFNPNNSIARGSYADENPFCAENIDVTNYLNLHSYAQHDDFCLAYVFTYRDFSGGTLGLAWVAEPSGSGGVCEKHRLMREGTHNVYKSLNTGVVTLLNYGFQVAPKVSQLTFAHEMGHNFGAKHDDDHKDEPYGCLPAVDDPRGNYIMFASATSGDKDNNNKFSSCSTDSIARLLDRVLSNDGNCFLSSDGPFCGNQLTEEGEQCDCGFTRNSCRDHCCNPKESAAPCRLTERIWVNDTFVNVQCSPTAGECCTHDCQYRDQRHLCRAAGECHLASFCNGIDAKCPLPEYLPDGTPCQDHTRVCKQGQCLGSICERIPGWHECSLTRDKNITPEMMCFVACRQNRTGAPCVSTFQLEKDAKLQNEYPQLVSELLREGRSTKLKPGAPCDNYRGYCDVFLRCRSVEAEGPLARLRDLLFSPQMLEKVKTWITVHWWAVIMICLFTVIAMIVFVKMCAVNTPASRLRFPEHGRPIPFGPIPRDSGEPHIWTTATPVDWRSSSNSRGVHSPWAWSRRKRSPHNFPQNTVSSECSRRVVPTAPMDPMDFPPPNARQTPIPYIGHSLQSRVVSDEEMSERSPFIRVNPSFPIASTSSQSNSNPRSLENARRVPRLRNRNSDGSNARRHRPASVFAFPDAGGAPAADPGRPSKKKQPKLPSKLRPALPREPKHKRRRPLSTFVSDSDVPPEFVRAPVINYGCLLPSQFSPTPTTNSPANKPNITRVLYTQVEIPHAADSSIPPPAYEDLPL